MLFIILNGKKAADETVRLAISKVRKELEKCEVRVTYEYGDVTRFLSEALAMKSRRVIIGGGDGSVNEMVDALAKIPETQRPELAILPLGTANDFATACTIPAETFSALKLATLGSIKNVDIVKANERHFINMATAGFGAAVTAETPPELKNFLGGGAYTLTGVLKAINFTPYRGKIKTPDFESEHTGVIAAICNGRQAGGGQLLAPNAFINDGLLDVLIISHFTLADIPTVIDEIRSPSRHGKFVKYFKTHWIEWSSKEYIPINLDGEPYRNNHIRFEIIPSAVKLVLPSNCPLVI